MSTWEQIVANYAEAPKIKHTIDEIPKTHKRCTTCKEVKHREEFYQRPDRPYECVSSRCRECQSVHNKALRLKRKQSRD